MNGSKYKSVKYSETSLYSFLYLIFCFSVLLFFFFFFYGFFLLFFFFALNLFWPLLSLSNPHNVSLFSSTFSLTQSHTRHSSQTPTWVVSVFFIFLLPGTDFSYHVQFFILFVQKMGLFVVVREWENHDRKFSFCVSFVHFTCLLLLQDFSPFLFI